MSCVVVIAPGVNILAAWIPLNESADIPPGKKSLRSVGAWQPLGPPSSPLPLS